MIGNSLTSANRAMFWIVFKWDMQKFRKSIPKQKINKIKPLMPIVYLFGDGFSLRASMPGFTYPWIYRIEKRIFDTNRSSMFCLIVLEKVK